MPPKPDPSSAFADLFQGYEKAHGKHLLLGEDEDGKIKGKAQTFAHGATLDDFKNHLKGEGAGLGIIPLREDNTCLFAAIDIDIRGPQKMRHTLEELEKLIREKSLPLVCCRSKSGGAHLYLFCSEPIPAALVTARLSAFAAILGYGGCEIFPKQIKRANEFDRGNWINLCYFAVKKTERYCLWENKPLTLEQFIEHANNRKVSLASLKATQTEATQLFQDGPPCLQHLASTGFDEGGRNSAMVNVGVYLKQKYPDTWQDEMMRFNYQHVKPPLSGAEIGTITKSLSRKDYNYTCSQPPICNHCDKRLCRKREFGVAAMAGDSENFPIEGLTKFHSQGSYRWYAQSNGERIELNTEQLLNPNMLRAIFLERFNQVVSPQNKDWFKRLKELMESVETIEDPVDASERGQLYNLIDAFLDESARAWDMTELLKGNLWISNERIFFRSRDLLNYLKVYRMAPTAQELWHIIKPKGGQQHKLSLKQGGSIHCWSLPAAPHQLKPYMEEPLDKGTATAFEKV